MSAAEDTLTRGVPVLIRPPSSAQRLHEIERELRKWDFVESRAETQIKAAKYRKFCLRAERDLIKAHQQHGQFASVAATPEEPSPVAQGDMPGTGP
jgi:hypothetical protein